MNAIRTSVNRQPLERIGEMRSPRGFWGVILLLAMIPLTLLYQMIFDYGAGTFTHWTLATGAALVSMAVFDFDKLPKWINWIGSLSAAGLAAIFFLQGLSDLVPNDSLAYVAYQVVGRDAEIWLLGLFVLVWCGALLFLDSQGRTKIFGFIALSLYIIEEICRLGLFYLGASPNGYLKMLVLVPFIWLLLESRKLPTKEN